MVPFFFIEFRYNIYLKKSVLSGNFFFKIIDLQLNGTWKTVRPAGAYFAKNLFFYKQKVPMGLKQLS